MKEIRQRSAEEILKELQEKARSYTPEWRFDSEQPDIGGALACVYAGMQSRLDRKYALLPEKLRIDFFNCRNVSMRKAGPAEGYVSFGLSGEDLEGSFLPAGTPLRSDAADENGEPVPVELMDDVYVVPDTLSAIYETRGSRDYIGMLYTAEGADENEENHGFPLFGMSAENLEHHTFRISHPYLFLLNGYAGIGLSFTDRAGRPLPEEVLSRFADPRAVRFYYETGDEAGTEELTNVRLEGDTIWIRKGPEQEIWAETEHLGVTARWLCCEVLDIRGLENFSPAGIRLSAACPSALPDSISAAGTDLALEEPCLPFDEHFSVFDEVYFGAGDALSKKGAIAELSFQEEFVRIPISEVEETEDVEWKPVMSKDRFKEEKQYEITIKEVIWEYYNGVGWTRLFRGSECGNVFCAPPGSGRQFKTIRFRCPDDLSPVLAGSGVNYYIRARILKVNNAYKTSGVYVAPVLSDVRISWKYEGESVEPEYMTEDNHLEERLVRIRTERMEGRPLTPIRTAEDGRPAMYLGFRETFPAGPVRMLWEMEQSMQEEQPEIRWEYYNAKGWTPLMPADETENFRRTGLLTWAGIPDALRKRMFGQELYWIRAVQTENDPKVRTLPYVRNRYLNAARALTIRHGLEEYLTLENREADAELPLLNRHIHRLELWVREDELLSREEAKELTEAGRLREVRDENGDRSFSWVRWEQTDSLRRHDPGDRVYMLDENEGILHFGGGANGRIPAPGVIDGIYVRYSIGGGTICNLPAGAVNALELTEGYVSQAYNPMPFTGGCDRETVSEAIRRAAAEQKHRFHPVTESDFEEMAMSAVRSIRKARCFSGMDDEGKAASGAVTLVVLPDDFNDRSGGFEWIKERLYKKFEGRLPAACETGDRFRVRRAEIVEIELHIDAVISDYQRLYRIQKNLQEKLTQFLDPVHGNFDGAGWEIGTLPEASKLETLIRSAEGIENLRLCTVFARIISRTGSPAISYEQARKRPFVVPVGGRHQFRLERKNSRA